MESLPFKKCKCAFFINLIVIINVERTEASLKSRSTLLRRSFCDAKKCKLDVLSQSTMRNAKEERVRFRRGTGSQVNVVKSNKREVILLFLLCKEEKQKNNIQDSNVVPHRSTNWTRQCLTSLSRREAVFSLLYGRS